LQQRSDANPNNSVIGRPLMIVISLPLSAKGSDVIINSTLMGFDYSLALVKCAFSKEFFLANGWCHVLGFLSMAAENFAAMIH
jgi:hypothetical protein